MVKACRPWRWWGYAGFLWWRLSGYGGDGGYEMEDDCDAGLG